MMRGSNHLMNPSTGVSSNIAQLSRCLVDDRRNLGDLFRGQIEFGAKPFFHPSGDLFRMMQFKEMIPRVGSPNERPGDCTRVKHQKEAGDEFPLQRPVHFKTHPASPNPRCRLRLPTIRGFRDADSLSAWSRWL